MKKKNNTTKSLINRIGFCRNRYLQGTKGQPKDGHYVIIRKIYQDGTCDVNTFTSLTRKKNSNYKMHKINMVRDGNIYPIPKNDADFNEWSGFCLKTVKNVPLERIKLNSKTVDKKHIDCLNKLEFYNKK